MNPKICIPIIANTFDELVDIIEKTIVMRPDLIEWRADYLLSDSDDGSLMNKCLRLLSDQMNGLKIPLIFTLRSAKEGGRVKYGELERLKLIKQAVLSGQVQLLDLEMDLANQSDEDFDHHERLDLFNEIIDLAHTANIEVILSHHDFIQTPSTPELIMTIKRAQKHHADYCKLAYIPKDGEDVIRLLEACQYGRGVLNQRMIVVSMGKIGRVSRITAHEYGSEFTYAKGLSESAPGQLTVAELLDAWAKL